MKLVLYELNAYLILQLCFGHQKSFAIKADVVPVVFHLQTGGVYNLRRSRDRVLKLRLKVDVLSVIARRIGIGDIRGYQFLPGTQQIHVVFDLSGEPVQHNAALYAAGLPV